MARKINRSSKTARSSAGILDSVKGPVESARRSISQAPSWVFILLGVATVLAVSYAAGWNDDIEDLFDNDEDDDGIDDDEDEDDDEEFTEDSIDEPGDEQSQNYGM